LRGPSGQETKKGDIPGGKRDGRRLPQTGSGAKKTATIVEGIDVKIGELLGGD